jgi:hypothetical protein
MVSIHFENLVKKITNKRLKVPCVLAFAQRRTDLTRLFGQTKRFKRQKYGRNEIFCGIKIIKKFI